MWFVHANLPIGRLTSVRTVDPHWGEWLNSSVDFNPNHNHVNAAAKQVSLQITSRPNHHAAPKQIVYKCPHLNTYLWNKNIKKSGIGLQIFRISVKFEIPAKIWISLLPDFRGWSLRIPAWPARGSLQCCPAGSCCASPGQSQSSALPAT